MKKNISNYEALLISLASDGDCTAFHSLIIHHLSACHLKLIEDGISHSDASAKLCTTGANLFKNFIGAHPANFESWLNANGESNNNSEHEFLPSNKTEHKQKLFSNELHLHLQRLSSSLNTKKKKKYDIKHFFKNTTLVVTALIVFVILSISISGYLFFSHSAIKLQLINKTAEYTLLFVGAKQQITPVLPITKNLIVDSSKTDTILKTSLKVDTVVKVKERPIQPKRATLVNGTENQISRNSSGSQSGSYRSTENLSVPTTSTVEPSPATPTTINPNESSGNQNNYQRQPAISADSSSNRYH